MSSGYLLVIAMLLGSCTPDSAVSESVTLEATDSAATESVAPLVTPTAGNSAVSDPTTDIAGAAEASAPAEAAQGFGSSLFFCRTAQGKVLEVNDLGSSIQYVFGPEQQPELVLNVPRNEASTYQWEGFGRYESYSVSVPNGNTLYTVFWARDRLNIEQPPEGGVTVEIDGEYVTTVDCATDINHNMIGVDLPPTVL